VTDQRSLAIIQNPSIKITMSKPKKATPKKRTAAKKPAAKKKATANKATTKPVAQRATTTATKKKKPKEIRVKFLKTPYGKYKIPYFEGQEAMIETVLAETMIRDKYAEKL